MMKSPLLFMFAVAGLSTACEPVSCTPIETAATVGGTYDLRVAVSAVLSGGSNFLVGEIAGDLDGDGCTDVLLSDPVADCAPVHSEAPPEIQTAYVHFGTRELGKRSWDGGDLEVFDTVSESWFGSQIRSAGDVNGDGHDDLWVGSQFVDTAAQNGGIAYLIYGPVHQKSMNLADADVRLWGSRDADLVGFRIAAADLNDDGYSDVLLPTRNNGRVLVHYGPSLSSGPVDQVADQVIETVKAQIYDANIVGDLNGDGTADVAVLAWDRDGDGGDLYLFHSPILGVLDLDDAVGVIRHVDPKTSPCGLFVAGGDLNGDGRDDLLCGSDVVGTNLAAAAALRIFYGPIAGTRSASSADVTVKAPVGHGQVIPVGGGDFNADGRADFAMTTHVTASEAGAVYPPEQLSVFTHIPHGVVSVRNADLALLATGGQSNIGPMLNMGDATGDGIDDLMLDISSEFLDAEAWIIAGRLGL